MQNKFIRETMRIFVITILICMFDIFATAKSKYVQLGEKAFSRAAYDQAQEYFEQAIESGDKTGDPHFYIGLILETKRKYNESIPYFKTAVEYPMSVKFKKAAYWKLVILLRESKQFSEALIYANYLEEMGEKSDLLDKLKIEAESGELNPSQKGFAQIKKGMELEKSLSDRNPKKNLDEVYHEIIQFYDAAINENSAWGSFRWKIAQYYEKLRMPEKAQAEYLKIFSQIQDPNAAYKIGLYHKRRSEYSAALKYFSYALEKPNLDAQLHFYVRYTAAQAYYGSGNFQEALVYVNRAALLAEELDLKKKTRSQLSYFRCLCFVSNANPKDLAQCAFDKKFILPPAQYLFKMKLAHQNSRKDEAAKFAMRAFDKAESVEEEGAIPRYALIDLPLAVQIVFSVERYADVIDLTDRFSEFLKAHEQYHKWRGVSYFAEKDYRGAHLEFKEADKLSPSQMHLHLLSLLNLQETILLKETLLKYLNSSGREKIIKELRAGKYGNTLESDPLIDSELKRTENKPSVNP